MFLGLDRGLRLFMPPVREALRVAGIAGTTGRGYMGHTKYRRYNIGSGANYVSRS